jgi:hypothetical protein
MKALISPNELIYKYDGTVLGNRVAQVGAESFEIAPPLFWVECSNEVVVDQYYYANDEIILIPSKPEIIVVTATFREFMALFTPAEQAAIVNSTDTQVKIFLLQASAGTITLSDPMVKIDLDYLVSLGLITTDRETAILAKQPPTV